MAMGLLLIIYFSVVRNFICQHKENPKKSYDIDLNLILKIIF